MLRGDGASGNAPIAFVEKQKGAMRIVASDRMAQTLGIAPGLSLADARARLPELIAVDHDPLADQALLEWIADDCDRYSPAVALNDIDGLTIDLTGCLHGADDEARIADRLAARLGNWGIHVRTAMAGTALAAQALARFQTAPAADEAGAVRRLPIAALRLDEETQLALSRAGLRTIGDLADRPSAPLSARFGEEMTDMLAQLLGRANSRIVPRHVPPALMFERRFAEPVMRTQFMLDALQALAGEAETALADLAKGGRCFAARLFRSDGQVRNLAIETSLPTRDPAAIMRLFQERIDTLSDPLDPGFGFDLVRLNIPTIEPLAPIQLSLEGGELARGELDALIDRLSTRLGHGRFRRMQPQDTHIPEQAMLALPMVEAGPPAKWAAPQPGEPPLRPIHLFDPPQAIEVIAQVPDGPPHRFRWRRALHEVTRFEGPERIAAQWWKRDDDAGLTRDYYRIEDARGRRYWIFRHGLYGTECTHPGWYMHGLFA